MANEYRVSQVSLEVLANPVAEAQVTALYLEALISLEESPSPVPIGLLTDFVDGHLDSTVFAPSVVRNIYPAFVDGNLDSIVWPIRHRLPPVIAPDVERNPYSPIRADDVEEQQRIIREQHNKTQAGDTTFDFGLLLKPTPKQLYTLGSIGRFYHPDFGILIARYVQFKDMVETDYQGCPVGRLIYNSDTVDWLVTNDFEKSGPEHAEGMTFLSEVPADGYYGWMVTQGANLTFVGVIDEGPPAQSNKYYWHSTGYLSKSGNGRALAYRWGSKSQTAGSVAGLMVNVGAFGLSNVMAEVEAAISALQAVDESLAQADTALAADVSSLNSALLALQVALDSLSAATSRDIALRAAEIEALRRQISSSTDWAAAILAESNLVRAEFAAADDALRTLVAAAKFSADAALAAIAGIDFASLSEQLTNLSTLVSTVAIAALEYHVPWGFTDAPAASEIMLLHTFPRAVVFAPDFAGLNSSIGTNPASTFVFSVEQEGVAIGTITISSGGVVTGSTSGLEVAFTAGEQLAVIGQASPDASFANSSFTWSGTKS